VVHTWMGGYMTTASKRSIVGLVGAAIILAGVLTLATLPARTALAGGPGCCQCPYPSCGPADKGKCDSRCKFVANSRCDGRTGKCTAATAFDSPSLDDELASLTPPGDLAAADEGTGCEADLSGNE